MLVVLLAGAIALGGCSSSGDQPTALLSADETQFDPAAERASIEDATLYDPLAEHGESPILAPRDGLPPVKDPRPRENSLTVNRRCRLEKMPTGWHMLRFVDEPNKPREANRFVLPSTLVSEMDAMQAKDPNVVFVVSGENLRYKKLSYMLVRLALIEQQAAVMITPRPAASTTQASTTTQATATTQATTTQSSAQLDPDEIVRRLLSERPASPILAPIDHPEDVRPLPSVAPVVKQQLQRSLGQLVSDRIMRLSFDAKSGWWIASFESDNTLQEQPLRVMPSMKLSEAHRLSESPTGRSIRLRISGEVFQYNGREYLLLRRVQRELILGQI